MSESLRTLIFSSFFVLLCAGSSPAFAEGIVEVENKSYWICKNLKQVRTIRVAVNQSGICSTYYSKDGSEKKVGSGKNHGSCQEWLENVKTNLEKSNWACRDISATRITASSEE